MRRTILFVLVALSTALALPEVASGGTPTCQGEAVTVRGTSGDDDLRGTRRHDVIAGLGGDDVIFAGDGSDTVCGGGGNDTVNASWETTRSTATQGTTR